MKHVNKTRSIQLAMVVLLALLAVPIAQAKQDANFSGLSASAAGIKADGLRLQAEAMAYLPEDRTVAVQLRREANQLNAQTSDVVQRAVAGNFGQYPFTTSQVTSSSPAPISENSPIELRVQPGPQTVTPVSHPSFSWDDAGIGAGIAALVTALAALGASGVVSRRKLAHA